MKLLLLLLALVCLCALSPAEIIHVSVEQSSIQAGIDQASKGDTVLVDEGTYIENISFKGKAITVASRFILDDDTSHISKTIIDGSQPSNPDNGSVVQFISGEDTNSVLCGFTITGGTGTVAWDEEIAGGGIWCMSGGTICNNIIRENGLYIDIPNGYGGGICAGWTFNEYVIIRDNTISFNTVEGSGFFGGGIACFANGKIINNRIIGNTATSTGYRSAGGLVVHGNRDSKIPLKVDVYGNLIKNNQVYVQGSGDIRGYGGGIMYYAAEGMIYNNTIIQNSIESDGVGYGGGIFINAAPNTIVANNLISDNDNKASSNANGGGICYGSEHVDGKISLYNNLIVYNKADAVNANGGGIFLGWELDEDAVLINNTIAFNEAQRGGGISVISKTGVIFNTIVWGNKAKFDSHIQGTESQLKVRYSDIQAGFEGEGNISADPLFLDTESFKLSENSPCIDKGIDSIEVDGSWYRCPDCCYFGNSRNDAAPDMGWHEYKYVDFVEDKPFLTPKAFTLSQNYPNPFNPTTTISYQLPKACQVEMSIYNLLGQKVAVVVAKKQAAGQYQLQWDASGFASGIYYYKIQAGEFVQVKKMVLIR
jgi:hypothetical protein